MYLKVMEKGNDASLENSHLLKHFFKKYHYPLKQYLLYKLRTLQTPTQLNQITNINPQCPSHHRLSYGPI